MFKNKVIAGAAIGCLCWNSSFAAIYSTTSTGAAETKTPIGSLSAEAILNNGSDLRGKITRGLQDERIVREMERRGVTQGEVELRLAAMSDTELLQLQQGAHRQAGGDVVIFSSTALIIILLVIILLIVA